MEWVQVSKDEFFDKIGHMNVHPRHEGPWPYTSYFETPDRRVKGKIEKGNYYLPRP